MDELLATERSYIKDLEAAIDGFLKPMMRDESVPSALKGKESLVFGNLEDIYRFHKDCLLPEMEVYADEPHLVGQSFVKWSEKLKLYGKYCVKKTQSTSLVVQHGQSYFKKLQEQYDLRENVESHLIKPVQRVTRYPLLLKELLRLAKPEETKSLEEAIAVCVKASKEANDALHLSDLVGCNVSLDSLGQVVKHRNFDVIDTKQVKVDINLFQFLKPIILSACKRYNLNVSKFHILVRYYVFFKPFHVFLYMYIDHAKT
jgi:hypothetical protein